MGGIIPQEDVLTLKEMGVTEVFGPGTLIGEVITCLEEAVKR